MQEMFIFIPHLRLHVNIIPSNSSTIKSNLIRNLACMLVLFRPISRPWQVVKNKGKHHHIDEVEKLASVTARD